MTAPVAARDAPVGEGTDWVPDRRTLVAFASMLVAIFLAALDSTVVATSLPAIASDLGAGGGTWVVTSFLLATAVSIPLWGKVSDLVGRRRPYLLATGLFLVSSLIAGTTPALAGLVVARAVQGLATGGLMALTPTIVGELFPAAVRGRYQGITGAVLASAGIAGPLAGGAFVDTVGWRWAFLVNVPVGGLALAGVVRSLHLEEHPRPAPLDWPGAVLLSGASLSALLALGERSPLTAAPANLVLLAVGAAALVAFVARERRAPSPLVPLRLLRNPVVRNALVLGALAGAVVVPVTVFVPLFVQTVEGSSATSSGLVVVPLTAGMLVSSVVGGNLMVRLGRYKPLPVAGTIAVTVGLGALATVGPHTPYPLLGASVALIGAGLGCVMQPALLAIQTAVARDDLGTATAGAAFVRQMAGTAAIGLLGGLLSRWAGDALDVVRHAGDAGAATGGGAGASAGVEAARATAAGAIGDLFLVLVPVGLAAIAAAVTLRDRRLR